MTRKCWYFSVIDVDDHEEYVDTRGHTIARDDAVEFVGTESAAIAESKRRSDLWEEINDCCCAEVVRHSMGGGAT